MADDSSYNPTHHTKGLAGLAVGIYDDAGGEMSPFYYNSTLLRSSRTEGNDLNIVMPNQGKIFQAVGHTLYFLQDIGEVTLSFIPESAETLLNGESEIIAFPPNEGESRLFLIYNGDKSWSIHQIDTPDGGGGSSGNRESINIYNQPYNSPDLGGVVVALPIPGGFLDDESFLDFEAYGTAHNETGGAGNPFVNIGYQQGAGPNVQIGDGVSNDNFPRDFHVKGKFYKTDPVSGEIDLTWRLEYGTLTADTRITVDFPGLDVSLDWNLLIMGDAAGVLETGFINNFSVERVSIV